MVLTILNPQLSDLNCTLQYIGWAIFPQPTSTTNLSTTHITLFPQQQQSSERNFLHKSVFHDISHSLSLSDTSNLATATCANQHLTTSLITPVLPRRNQGTFKPFEHISKQCPSSLFNFKSNFSRPSIHVKPRSRCRPKPSTRLPAVSTIALLSRSLIISLYLDCLRFQTFSNASSEFSPLTLHQKPLIVSPL